MLSFDIIHTRPLSGRGAEIVVVKINEDNSINYYIKWGSNYSKLSRSDLDGFIKEFFVTNEYKPLGASQDKQLEGGFGEYLNKKFSYFTPRHASVIASLMVVEGFISFNKSGKSILLKKSMGKKVNKD